MNKRETIWEVGSNQQKVGGEKQRVRAECDQRILCACIKKVIMKPIKICKKVFKRRE
jgi:hypothetical protein